MLLLRSGGIAEANAAADEGCEVTNELIARDPTVNDWRENSRRCLGLRAELAAIAGSNYEALSLARQLLDATRATRATRATKLYSARDRFSPAQTLKLLGDLQWMGGDRAGARASWTAGLASWPKDIAETPRQLAERGEMLRGTGQRAEGMRIASQLAAMGYRQSISNRARL